MMHLILNIRIFNGTGTDTVLIYLNYSVWLWVVLWPSRNSRTGVFFKKNIYILAGGGVLLYVMLCTICMQ